MLYFSTRSKARAFAVKSGRKVSDFGQGWGKLRWGVKAV